MLFVVMFFGLGIDFSLHFILRAMADGSVGEQGLKHLKIQRLPSDYARSISHRFSRVCSYRSWFRELGLISAAGMLIALLTLLFVPAAISNGMTITQANAQALSTAQIALDSAWSPPPWLPFSCWIARGTRDRARHPVQLQRPKHAKSGLPRNASTGITWI